MSLDGLLLEKLAKWRPDGRHILVIDTEGLPAAITSVDVESGAREPVRQLVLPGADSVRHYYESADGATYAYTAVLRESTLFVVDGLR